MYALSHNTATGYRLMDGKYTDTTTDLARLARVNPATIRLYADEGLLDFVVIRDGMRLFRTGQADRVKALRAERIARRGNRRPKEQSA